MEYINNVTPIMGQYYLVPCIEVYYEEDDKELMCLTPVIDHPHNDVENGQDYVHYHIDTRFVGNSGVSLRNNAIYQAEPRPMGTPVNYALKCVRTEFTMITLVDNIAQSRLRHQCIYKGKCPHRGYDLTHIQPVDGVVTCPLHGLKFRDGQLINFPNLNK